MTSQLPDFFILENKAYPIYSGAPDFRHTQYAPSADKSVSTACWRGYQAVYSISEPSLVLNTLSLRFSIGDPHEINGVVPEQEVSSSYRYLGLSEWFNAYYHDLNLEVDYSGIIKLDDAQRSNLDVVYLGKIANKVTRLEHVRGRFNQTLYQLNTFLKQNKHEHELSILRSYRFPRDDEDLYDFARVIIDDMSSILSSEFSGAIHIIVDNGEVNEINRLSIMDYIRKG